jgi:hypothetical protein
MSCGGDGDSTNGGVPSSGRIDLATDSAGFSITFRPGDLHGNAPYSVASGDFNDDGDVDLLLGAPFADGPDASRTDAGEALIVFGPVDANTDLSSRAPDLRMLGASAGDMLGAGVAAGDLNADGIDDIIVGAPGSNGIPEQRTDMGEAYVVFGGGDLPSTIDAREKQYDFLLQPAEGFSSLGRTFAIADINDDGTSDLVAGAPYAGRVEGTPPGSPRTTVGEVYVVFGRDSLGGTATVVNNDEDVRLSGVNEYDQFGISVASADVNGDSIPDIVVGASGFDGPGGEQAEAGGVFVFYGGRALPAHKTYLQADITITGRDANDAFGTLVAATDANGDGKAEIIGAAPSGAGPANERFAAGEVTIIDVASADSAALTAETGVHIFAPTDGELLSGSLAVTAGDRPRVAIGSTMRNTPERPGSGWVYLLDVPSADVDLASENSGALLIKGAAERDGLGGALLFADLGGDGRLELLAEAAGGVQTGGGDSAFVGRLFVIRLPD